MEIDFKKYPDGLVPTIVQDNKTRRVLMLGFMNEEAIAKTNETGRVTFYSRSKQRLWTKGEESGHFLELKGIRSDCDRDTILVQAHPLGPVCHTGSDTCFDEINQPDFLSMLQAIIADRFVNRDPDSYTSGLFDKGINAVAQKVGEEAIELVIEAKDDHRERFLNEAADLLFHYLVLLQAKQVTLDEVLRILSDRNR